MSGAQRIQVLEKSVNLLVALANHGEQTVGQLAELTSEPKTTVYRLIRSLETLGFVESGTGRGAYRVGLRVLEIGSSVLGRFDQRQAAQAPMQELSADTQHTVYLCVRDDERAVCIDRIGGRWVRSMLMQVGSTLPLHVGAAPTALLAFEGPELWSQYIRNNSLEGIAPGFPNVEPDAFLRRLEQAREQGYVISNGDAVIGMAGIAAPVFDFSDRVCASISLSGPCEALLGRHQHENVRRVMSTAERISRVLGHRSPEESRDTVRHLAWLDAARS